MKKLLLTGAALMAFSFFAKAQSTSFEQSEGYTLSDVNNQQGWYTTAITDANNEIIGYVENQVISDESASDGEYSLQLNKEEEYPGLAETIVGAFRNFTTTEDFSLSYDIYIGQQSEDDSDFSATLFAGEEGTLSAQIQFAYTGEIVFRFPGEDEETGETVLLAYLFESEPTWEPQTWYNVALEYNAEADEVTFFLDDVELGTFPSIAQGELISGYAFRHDNFGGFAYVDNVVTEGATMGVNTPVSAEFSVSPNPANSVVTIANADNALVNAVTIADINGRVVKTASFAGAAQAQVNVSDLANGVYMMTISSDKGSVTKKIVKN